MMLWKEGAAMQSVFPTLVREINDRGIKKTAIAKQIGVSVRSLYSKLSGETSFKWNEVQEISSCFFPDMDVGTLFEMRPKDKAG